MISPIFQISSRQECLNESKKTTILNLFPKDTHHDGVVEGVEAGGDVSLDKVGRSYPLVIALSEGGVTSSIRAKAVGMGTELRPVVGREDESKDLLKQL